MFGHHSALLTLGCSQAWISLATRTVHTLLTLISLVSVLSLLDLGQHALFSLLFLLCEALGRLRWDLTDVVHVHLHAVLFFVHGVLVRVEELVKDVVELSGDAVL